jgi:hypothetical protein
MNYIDRLCWGPRSRVVTWMDKDGRMRTRMRTMAAGSYVTSTHYSVRYKVTLGINRRVRADASVRSR